MKDIKKSYQQMRETLDRILRRLDLEHDERRAEGRTTAFHCAAERETIRKLLTESPALGPDPLPEERAVASGRFFLDSQGRLRRGCLIRYDFDLTNIDLGIMPPSQREDLMTRFRSNALLAASSGVRGSLRSHGYDHGSLSVWYEDSGEEMIQIKGTWAIVPLEEDQQ